MNPLRLERHQARALAALQALAGQLGWKGEAVGVEGTLVFQIPLPADPDVSGAFFAIDANELNIRLYLTMPFNAPQSQMAEASEFVIWSGYSQRFGALELDLDHGSLRVRIDTDATDATLEESTARLLDRAMALGREVSPGWRALCRGAKAMEALGLHAVKSGQRIT